MLRSVFAAIAQWLRSHCAAGAQTLRSGCAALRSFITQRCAVGAQPLRSKTRVRNGCVIVITQPLRSHYAQGNLLMLSRLPGHALAGHINPGQYRGSFVSLVFLFMLMFTSIPNGP